MWLKRLKLCMCVCSDSRAIESFSQYPTTTVYICSSKPIHRFCWASASDSHWSWDHQPSITVLILPAVFSLSAVSRFVALNSVWHSWQWFVLNEEDWYRLPDWCWSQLVSQWVISSLTLILAYPHCPGIKVCCCCCLVITVTSNLWTTAYTVCTSVLDFGVHKNYICQNH